MRVQGSEGNSTSKVYFAAFWYGLFGQLIQVSFGKAEVNDVNAARIAAKHKIAGFHVSVDKAAFVNFADRSQHFNQNMDCNFE